MRSLAARFEDPASVDKVARLNEKARDLQGLMRQNVRKAIQNSEGLEALEQETVEVSRQAREYSCEGNQVRRHFWYKDLKITLALGALIVVLTGCLALWVLDKLGFLDSDSDGTRRPVGARRLGTEGGHSGIGSTARTDWTAPGDGLGFPSSSDTVVGSSGATGATKRTHSTASAAAAAAAKDSYGDDAVQFLRDYEARRVSAGLYVEEG